MGLGAGKDRMAITRLDKRFTTLSEQWLCDTSFYSTYHTICSHPAFAEIVAMGEDVIPLLLEHLRSRPDARPWWMYALYDITGISPIPPESQGNVDAMSEAWLTWGAEQGYPTP